MSPLSDDCQILCHKDGSICTIDGAFLCPDFPEDADSGDATYQEVRDHIHATGLSVERLLNFASAVQDTLSAQEWSPDTLGYIADAMRNILGLEILDLPEPSDDTDPSQGQAIHPQED